MKNYYSRNPINIFIFLLMMHIMLFGNIIAGNTYFLDKNTTIKTPKTSIFIDNESIKKFEQIDNLFKQLDAGILTEMDFFKQLGEKKLSVKDLVEFKANTINGEAKNKKNYQNGIDVWNYKYRHMEQNLMKKRREVILDIWNDVASEYMKNHPDCDAIARMDVGGWVNESKEKMRFEGDIDFTVVMIDTSNSIEIRNRFNQKVNKIFKMDMVAIDALATAHRAATLSVYIGDYGANWAEIDAINRGKMHIITHEEDGTLAYRDATPVEKSVLFAVLKNNVAISKGEPDRLAEILQEKDTPEPKYDMEPGISLEFLRHITGDAFNSKLALHEKVIKMSKYLNRSVAEHNKILKSAGMKPVPTDVEISRYASDIIRFKQSSVLGPEAILLGIMRRTGYLLNDNSWVLNPEKSLGQIEKRMSKVIIHNITEGIDAYKKVAKEKSTIDEQDRILKEMLDVLEEEYKAFSDEGMEDQFPDKALIEMHELAKYFNENNIKMSSAEQKKIKELLEKIADNPKAVNTWMGILYQHALKVYGSTDKAIDFINDRMDYFDNHSVQKIRNSMVGFNVNSNGKVVSVSIGSLNHYLNGTILGTVGNSVPYKGINLALEGKAYYDSLMNADTWSQGFVNLGYELMSRRLPGYAATGAWVKGDYSRLAVEMTYLVFPITAVPEGLYGMAKGTAEWGIAKLDEWEYNALVDTLYDSAKFQKKNHKWYMTELSYPCPNPKKTIHLTINNGQIEQKDGLYKLLISCPHVSSILYPKIHDHPALKQFEEMLDSPAVSSGKAEILGFGAGWPYFYIGLSPYGKKLYNLYLKKVDEVTLEYFKGVIDGIEKRKAWQTGTGYAQIIKIEKKIGCRRPLVEYTKSESVLAHIKGGGDDFKEEIKRDAKRFQNIVDTYNKLEQSNKKIMDLRDKWKANFLKKSLPYCSVTSIKKVEKNMAVLLENLNKGVKRERIYVEKIIGMNPAYKYLQPPTKARLCMIYFKNQKTQKEKRSYKRCYEDYQDIKKRLKEKSGLFSVKINVIPDKKEFCPNEKIKLSVSYSVRRDNSEVNWIILNKNGEIEEKLKDGTKTVWIPRHSGKKTIYSLVKIPFSKVVKGVYESKRELNKKILIKPEKECSKLEIKLDSGGVEQISKDSKLTIEAKILSLSPGSPSVDRYFWFENGKQVLSSEQSDYIFSGKGKGGETVIVEAVARDKNGNLSKKEMLKIKVNNKINNALQVKIVPSEKIVNTNNLLSIKDSESILLKAIVNKKDDSGKLKFRWSANKRTVLEGNGNTINFNGKSWSGKKVTIDVIVMDKRDREGNATLILDVKSSQRIDVELEKHKNLVAEREHLKLRVKKPKQTNNKEYKYTWKRDGNIVVDKMEFDYFDISDFQGKSGKSVKFSVEVFDERNESIGEAETIIFVSSSKKDDEKDIKVKPTTLKITAPTANQETPETTILVAGKVSAFENITSMQMIVNGVVYQMKPSAKFSQKMPIVPGKNTLQVSAKLKDGRVVHSQTVTVKSTQSAENRYRFTLRWNTARTDIDLWLVGPTGESCSYNNKNSSFAKLDRDEIRAGYGPENIFIAHLTDYGKYKVRVQYFADHNKEDSEEEIPTTPTGAEVLFFIDNKLSKRWTGSLASEKQWWDVYSFTYGMDIEINSPAKTSVKIGETLNLTAKLKETSKGLGEMLKGKHVFRWVGDNGVEFSPADTLKPKTTALFTRPGKVKIRVQVMVKQGDELKKVGESKEITIDVVGVTYKLQVTPPKPMVGQEAVITVVPDYDVDKKTLDFRWEVSGPVLRQGLMEAGNAWKYGVTSKASKLITVIARGRTPFHGDGAGEATLTFTPQLYTVKVVKQGNAYGGMSVRVYDPQLRDFVEAPQGTVITDQTMRLHATIEGEPLPSGVHWKWTVNEGTSLGNDSSQEPTVMRHESGTVVAKVEARNKEDVILGSTEISFSVFESDHGPKASQIKLKDAQKAWENGDISRAIILINEAKQMNPKDAVIRHESERMHKDSIRIKSLLKKTKALKVSGKLKEAKINVDNALKLNKKYNPAIRLRDKIDQLIKQQKERELAKKKRIAQLLKKAKAFKNEGKLSEAAAVLKKGSKQFPTNKEIIKMLKEVQKQQRDALKKLKEGQREWKNGILDKAISIAKEAVSIDPSNNKISKVFKAMQVQKKTIDTSLQKADKLIEQKKFDQAKGLLKKAERISSKYPPYVEMVNKLNHAVDAEEARKEKIRKQNEKTEREKLAKEKATKEKAEREKAEREAALAQKIKEREEKARDAARVIKIKNDKAEAEKREKEAAKQKALHEEAERAEEEKTRQLKELEEKKTARIKNLLSDAKRKWKNGEKKRAIAKLDEILLIDSANQETTELKREWKNVLMGKKTETDPCSEQMPHKIKDIGAVTEATEGKNNEGQNMEILSASGVVGNTLKLITVILEPGNSKLIKMHITEGSELTYQTDGKQDGARIGEVEFYANGRKVTPNRVEADSTFGAGYSIDQIMDGDREYRYMTSGAKGWASADKQREAWITFYFDREVDITKAIISTAPTRPYRLYSFSLIKYKTIKNPSERTEEESIIREIEAELEKIESEEHAKQADTEKKNEEERIAREIEAELKAIETAESIRKASELASKTVHVRKKPPTISGVKKKPFFDRRQDIIVGKWKNPKGVIIRFDKKSTGEYIGSMVYFDKRLLSYGFRVGEVGYRLKYIGNGKYRGKSKVHHRDRSTSWKNISYEVRGDRILRTGWRRTSANGIVNRNTKREKFMGTMSGSWKGPWVRGSFRMQISENGRISGTYWGDDKGKLSGYVSTLGALNVKSGGGAAGSGKWGGTMIVDSNGRLHGKGTWRAEGYSGTWRGR